MGWDAGTAILKTSIKGDDRGFAWTQAVHGDGPRGRWGCAAGEVLCAVCCVLCAVCLDIERRNAPSLEMGTE